MKSIFRTLLLIISTATSLTLRGEEIRAYHSSTDAGELVYYLSRERLDALSIRPVRDDTDVRIPLPPEAAIQEAVSVVEKEHKEWLIAGFYLLTLSDLEVDGRTILHYSIMLRVRKKDGAESVLTIPVLMDGKSMAFRRDSQDGAAEPKEEKNEPNNAVELTPASVTPPAVAGAAPLASVAHLGR